MNEQDGGPAYPVARAMAVDGSDYIDAHFPGMTLRDYFAGQVLGALVAKLPSRDADSAMAALGYQQGETDRFVAKCAYDYADAMLAARAKQ